MSLKIENLQQLDSKQLIDLTVDEAIAINGGTTTGGYVNYDMEMWKKKSPKIFPTFPRGGPHIPVPRFVTASSD